MRPGPNVRAAAIAVVRIVETLLFNFFLLWLEHRPKNLNRRGFPY